MEISPNNPEAFLNWRYHRKEIGGHPYEILPGGSFTRILLYPERDENGWCYTITNAHYTRNDEVIKAYLALKDSGLPVELQDAVNIDTILRGEDYIGITPSYAPSFRVAVNWVNDGEPDDDIFETMQLWHFESRDAVIKAAYWYPLSLAELK